MEAETSNWTAYDAVLRTKQPAERPQDIAVLENVVQKDPVVQEDPCEEMGPEARRVVKKLIQIARDKYGDEYDVIPAEKYQRRYKSEDPDKKFRGYAVVQRLVINFQGKLKDTRVEIQSRKLCALVKEIVPHLGGQVNLDTVPIGFKPPFHALFFLLGPLERHLASTNVDQILKEEAELLITFIKSPAGLHSIIKAYSEQVELHKVSFGLLWSLFPPGRVVYSHSGVTDGCSVVISTEYQDFESSGGASGFKLKVVQGYHNGDHYGLVRKSLRIPAFSGLVPISPEDLSVVPLDAVRPEARQSRIRNRLVSRGKEFCELQEATMSHRSYEGPFWALDPDRDTSPKLELGKHIQINSRVVIDSHALVRLNLWSPPIMVATSLRKLFAASVPKSDDDGYDRYGKKRARQVNDESNVVEDGGDTRGLDDLLREAAPVDEAPTGQSDEEYLICPPDIRCFFLAEQQWGGILVEHISAVRWSEGAFDKLQMHPSQKETIKALVRGFDPHRAVDFDDVIQYKGRGLVFLLHGEPGLGKTFTAESIAEHARLPLYHVTTGQLSNDVTILESELKSIFELGHRWKAVVLVDEADVLMAQRTENDLTRNAVVAVFLRLIEYYRGLLFLTTNRLQGLDTAFHNRVHVKVAYSQLSHAARTNIWRSLLLTSKARIAGSWPEDVFSTLGQLESNGRDIRNILRVAHSLRDGDTKSTAAVDILIGAIRINRSDQTVEQLREIDVLGERLRSIVAEGANAQHGASQESSGKIDVQA